MPQWRIGITSTDPNFLSFLVNSSPWQQPAFTIIEENGDYYLLSSDFESLTEYSKVDQHASKLLEQANSLIKLVFKDSNGLTKTGKGVYTDGDGHSQVIMTLSTNARVLFKISAGDDFFQKIASQQPDTIGKWLTNKDPLIIEALTYYSQQHNWNNLYKIYEIIKRDVGKAENSRTLPRGTFDKWTQNRIMAKNFEQSANDFNRSSFDARHSSLASEARPSIQTISLQEASEFINGILIKWLDAKNK